MMTPRVIIGGDANQQLIDFCREQRYQHLILVADQNTFAAAGQRVNAELTGAGFDIQNIVLDGAVVPDESTLLRVLIQANVADSAFLAVGAGTINDITRFVSFKTGRPFISIPTAPSVDGFTSSVAALVIGGVKLTTPAKPPQAVFANSQVLVNAPQPMISAGFGDLLGKSTSLADWKLGHLLWNEKYDAAIAARTANLLERCVPLAAAIGRRETQAVCELMDALAESGNCILDFGSSHPASGSEHHLSHFLELKLLREKRPAILHGLKVGLSALTIARMYENLSDISKPQAEALLDASTLPQIEAERSKIKLAYPGIADEIINSQQAFLNLAGSDFNQLKRRILENWDEIQEIAAGVIPSQQIAGLLSSAGAATQPVGLGLGDDEVQAAARYAHYLRPRFTICKLMKIFYPERF